ncbi:MAG: hypothetical protein LW704_09015, partial [Cryomorphaceae bacterium]|nr:hypothetical protein [Cryomorphaceae bacterium]
TQNITNTQGVSITVNNQSISNFTLNTANGQIQSGITLNPGLNVIAVTVVNGCGTDIKTINVNYKACTPPSIQITNPVMNGSTVNTPVFAITGSFQNITSAQNVTLQQNGRAISGLSFNAQTGLFTANVNLNNGANSFTISVVNECGTASETILINYTAPVNNTPQMITICHYPPGNNGNPQTIEIPLSAWPAHQAHGDVLGPCPVVNPTPPCNPPAILVTNPTQNGQTVQQTSYTITASISNIANNQGINYVVNGKPITNFSLSNGVFSNTVNLVNGWNTFIITATNGCGSVTETITINYSSPVDNTPQMITICHYPPGNNGNPQTLEIPLASWPAHQAHGDVLGPCPVVNTPPCNPPSIQVTNPAQNNQTVQQPAFTVTANISNVANNQGISCLFNGMPMSSFVFANGEFSANVNLIPGTNNIVLTAVNTCGTDTETIAVNYSAPVDNTPQKVTICHYPPGNSGNPQTIEIPLSAWPAHQAHGDVLGPCPVVNTPPCNPPSIQVTNPTQSGQTVQQTSFNITANISNIANNQGIVYTVNGKPITSFSFSNGSFSNTVNLNAGINTFTITATNGCGTDTETITINYSAPAPQTMTICHQGNRTQETMVIPVSDWPMHQAHGDIMGACPQVAPTPPCNPPTIQVTNPTQSGQTVQQASFNITANISNIANSQGIIYTVNGKPMTSFSFSNGSFSNSVNLNVGINTFTITATNNCGTDTETITINYSAPTPPCNPPSIQVTNPTQNGIRVQSANFVFGATISNISNNQGVVMLLNGKPFVGFAFAPTKGGSLTSSLTLNPGTNMIVVTATNECGTDTETITINYVEPVEQKVVICHKSGNTTQTLEIPMSAWPAHQAHGDVLGPCPTQKPNENGGQQQNNGSGNEQPVKPEIKPATRGGNGETEAEPKEEENKEINKPGEGKVQGKGRG